MDEIWDQFLRAFLPTLMCTAPILMVPESILIKISSVSPAYRIEGVKLKIDYIILNFYTFLHVCVAFVQQVLL